MPPTPPHIAPVLARAAAAFRAQFGNEPTWAAAAPGRVNLIGEHTDYNGGFVLPIAIDRVCVAVGGLNPRESRVYTADLDRAGAFDTRAPIALKKEGAASGIERGSWLSYVAGVMAQFQRPGWTGFSETGRGHLARVEVQSPRNRDREGAESPAIPNLDIAIASSVPVGSGLSSSAAIEVATATLLEQALGVTLDPKSKALLCQRAEHEFAGVPCGIMDQFISVMGREHHALLIDCRSQEARPVPMPDGAVIVVMNTNIRHALAGGEYAKRRATCAAAAIKLGVRELRDADVRALSASEGSLSAQETRCARHVITENTRTLAAAEALRARDLSAFGQFMLDSHASLRDDYEVSCPELDTLVELAMKVPGVFGARMTGGGFGGCAVAMTEPGAPLRHAMCARDQHGAGRGGDAFEVGIAGGASPITADPDASSA